jgi:hypothetical protein
MLRSKGQGALEMLIILGILIIGAVIFSMIYIGNLRKENKVNKSEIDTLVSDFNSNLNTYEIPVEAGFNFNFEDALISISFLFLIGILKPIFSFKIINQKVI